MVTGIYVAYNYKSPISEWVTVSYYMYRWVLD